MSISVIHLFCILLTLFVIFLLCRIDVRLNGKQNKRGKEWKKKLFYFEGRQHNAFMLIDVSQSNSIWHTGMNAKIFLPILLSFHSHTEMSFQYHNLDLIFPLLLQSQFYSNRFFPTRMYLAWNNILATGFL